MLSKRIICLISAFALLLSLGSVWAAETTEEAADAAAAVAAAAPEDFEMTLAADVAVGLGALTDYMPTKEMTVGEMANAVSVIAPSTYIAQKYFNAEVYPAPVKRITAMAVMMDILGYSVFFSDGSIDEEDTAEIQSIAGKYDISDGIVGDANGIITMEEAAELILNTLEARTLTTIFSDSGSVEAFVSQDIYMERVLGLYLIDGVVQSTSYSSIIDAEGTKDGKIIISGEKYDCEAGKYEDYIGMRVTALVNKEEMSIAALHDTSKTYLEIPAKDLDYAGIQKRTISYWISNDKTRKISLSPVVDVLYNYSLFEDYTAEDLKIKQGRLVLIDNNDDSSIDVVKIEEYKSMQIFSVSVESETITDAYGNIISISDLIKFGYPVFENDQLILPNNIPINSVATCFVSKNNQAVRIYIDNKVAAGTVNKFDTDENTVTLEGKDMVYAEEIKEKLEKVEPGTLITVYLNRFDEIAHFEITGENYLYGYMISFFEGDIMSNPQVKMFTQMNTITVYETRDKISLNGTSLDAKQAFAYDLTTGLWDEAGKISQMVKYKANAKGEITAINTTTTLDPGDGSRLVKEKDDVLTYYSTPQSFGDDVRLDVYTKVFQIPTDLSYKTKFNYGSPTDVLTGSRSYTVQIYDVDENYYADVVVVRIDPYAAASSPADQISGTTYVVLEKGEFIADNGDISVFVEARALGSTSNVPIVMNFSKKDIAYQSVTADMLKPGDIIQGQNDYTNKKEYSSLVVWYQHGITQPFESVKGTWTAVSNEKHFYSDGQTYAAGTIKQIIKNGFVINHKPESTANYENWNRVITTTGITPVSIFEVSTGKNYAASVSDLQVGDKVFALYRTGLPREIVIYRD